MRCSLCVIGFTLGLASLVDLAAGREATNIPADARDFRKSWIAIAPSDPPDSVVEGDPFEVTIKYSLDPGDVGAGGVKLALTLLGPWIDNPDGKYTTKRQHIAYRGLTGRSLDAQAGRHTEVMKFTAPKAFQYNSLLLIAGFRDAGGKPWPWDVRAAGPRFIKRPENYSLSTDQPGNLFLYGQSPRIRIQFHEGAKPGERKTLRYSLHDHTGRSVKSQYSFTAGEVGAFVEFSPEITLHGTFALIGEVEGWGERQIVFGTIPDLSRIASEQRITPFAVTNVRTEGANAVASRLGFSMVRQFTSWKLLQPGPDFWALEALDRTIARNNSSHLRPWICLVDPPPFAQAARPRNVGFAPYAFDERALRDAVAKLGERYRGRIWGWEWLNEIVPGDLVADPVTTYADFVRIATTAARAADPQARIQLAGGLWPRNFRNDLLRRGIAPFIDVLPVHYSNFDGVRDAQEDLAAVGQSRIAVWDNESSRGLSVWGMPLEQMIRDRSQSQWVLERWCDELSAGARQITLFGGQIDPAGNWSYLLNEQTPRPYAVTLAVLISRLSDARPLGKSSLPGRVVLHAFERGGEGLLIASATGEKPVDASIPVGVDSVVVTDYQGNQTPMDSPGGKLALALSNMPVIIEHAAADLLKAKLALSIGGVTRPGTISRVSAMRGAPLTVPLRLRNLFSQPMPAKVSLRRGETALAERRITLEPGQDTIVLIDLPATAAATLDASWVARLELGDLPAVETPFTLDWIDSAMLGNLLKNGDFERDGGWSYPNSARRVESAGELGTGQFAARLDRTDGWVNISQGIALPAGEEFLYTAWIKTDGVKQAGSNITYILDDGTQKRLYIPHVFQAPSRTRGWHLLSYRGTVPEHTKTIQFTPVARGSAPTLFDNVRVTLRPRGAYAAEASGTKTAPRIDGDLREWTGESPVPLLCENQLADLTGGYDWSPDNLAGIARFRWDDQALYMAVEVIDDQHVIPPAGSGEKASEGDSITLAIQPSILEAESSEKAFAYIISAASPGGGSGHHTLYRPASRAGGLSSGELAKDSSNYDLAIRRDGRFTRYEVRLPWSELGVTQPRPGSQIGLSLQLHDRDEADRSASMLWGEGLSPTWQPKMFGVLTLTP